MSTKIVLFAAQNMSKGGTANENTKTFARHAAGSSADA